ncbi:UNVERIFIED_CONTAM: hypothetical protein O8I53_11725 [Campylobacter lari]
MNKIINFADKDFSQIVTELKEIQSNFTPNADNILNKIKEFFTNLDIDKYGNDIIDTLSKNREALENSLSEFDFKLAEQNNILKNEIVELLI